MKRTGHTGRGHRGVETATRRSEPPTATRYGVILAAVFVAAGVLLLALSAFGRGWPFLLGGIDFIVIGGVLYWAMRSAPR